MAEVVHTSRIRIVRENGPTRRATIEGFGEPIYYGVHGGIKNFYKVEPEKEHAGDTRPYRRCDRRLNDGDTGRVAGRKENPHFREPLLGRCGRRH